MSVDQALVGTVVARHHGVITRRRLRDLGLTDRVIDRLVARGRFAAIGNGVLRSADAVHTFEHRVAAACAVTGGVACFPTAGQLWEFRKTPHLPEVHVVVAWTRRIASPDGVVIHRSRCIPDMDVRRRADGISLTQPARTTFDAAHRLRADSIESMVEQGLDRELFTIPVLWALARRLCRQGRPGSTNFGNVVRSREAWQRPSGSDLELRLERAMRARGFPALVRQHELHLDTGAVIHPDLGLPADGFFVEVDHLTWHGGRIETSYDTWRDRQVRLRGLHIERVTDVAIERSLTTTVDDLWRLWTRIRGGSATVSVA